MFCYFILMLTSSAASDERVYSTYVLMIAYVLMILQRLPFCIYDDKNSITKQKDGA